MTLRDHFAGQAMAALVCGNSAATVYPDYFAKKAYEMADAMLQARSNGGEGD